MERRGVAQRTKDASGLSLSREVWRGRVSSRRLRLRPGGWVAAGLLVGNILSACFPDNKSQPVVTPVSSDQVPVIPSPTIPPEGAPELERQDIRAGELLVDDMSRCSSDLRTRINTWWYTYDDQDKPGEKICNRGLSRSVLRVALGGYPPSPCALEWRATLETRYTFSFAGIGVGLGDADLAKYKKVFMVVRGDGKNYRMKFPMVEQLNRARRGGCGNDDWNFYGARFACGNGSRTWVAIRIDLSELTLDPRWSQHEKPQSRFDARDVKSLEIQTEGVSGDSFACDIGLLKLIP